MADDASKSLLGRSEDGRLVPMFPLFLPLEVFDNTEYDCRTPEEWVDLGEGKREREGEREGWKEEGR